MATRFANIKGIEILEEPLGSEKGGIAKVTFDLLNTPYTGGADIVQLGGGGTDQYAVTALTLAALMQNRRRDGKTVTINGATIGPMPGQQAAATPSTLIYMQSVAASGGGNVTLNLTSAYSGGSAETTTVATWDRAASVIVQYTAT